MLGLKRLQGFLELLLLRNRSRIGINKWYQSFALRNFDLEDMEFESANSGTTAKLPILKLENGNSWVSVPQTAQENGTSVTKMYVPVTAEEKTNKKNDVKARSSLLMALPNEHQLTFTTRKTQKTLLKQQYENFSATSAESLDSIFNRLHKIVKKSVGASSGAQNLAFMTAPSTSSTNDANTASPQVSTASPNVNTASPQVSTASFSDNVVYAFMVENPNGSNLLHQYLEQIHEDDLEAMDLKWQLALLSVRAKRYYQRTGKKIFINANDTSRYDKSKVECFNCHNMGHFTRECKAPRSKEGQFKNQDNTRKQGNNEDTSSKAMLAIDGVGFDWSDMAEEQVQTNMALMVFSDSEVYNDKTCSKTCLKNFETLKKQCDDLIVKLNQTEFTATTYKRGLATLEEQLITYRKNEVLFSEEVAVLKREVACKDYEINVLKSEFEKVKQEKEGIEFKIEKFDKASKDLDQLLESQITGKSKKSLGYSAVPPPHPLIYNRSKSLIYNSKKCSDDSLVKEQESKDTSSFVESSLNVDKETVFPVDKKVESVKPKNHEKPVKKSVRFFIKTIPQSTVRRPFQTKTSLTNKRFTHNVNTAKAQAVNTARPKTVKTARLNFAVVNVVGVNQANVVKASACWVWRPAKPNSASITFKKHNYIDARGRSKASHKQDDTRFFDSGCSRHMTGNISYLSNFKEFDGGYVTFRGGAHGGRTSKGTLKTDSLDFEDILLKIPRKDNMYSFDMKNIVPKKSLTCLVCLVAKATSNESMLWHRRLGHINFKNINKLVKDNLVRVVTDDYSRFTWVFILTTKDETSEILKNFIKEIENLVDKKVIIIRSDNGTEFKNKVLDDFCREKGIKREYSVARTPQQNGVAERRNRTLIEAARTMLADSKLPTTFWAEAVSTACYVQNRVLVVKPHNKTPYELFRGFKPALSFMRPFGCHVTILNTLDSLGKFDGKSDEGFFVGYSLSSKAFRVYNTRTRRVEENLHIGFLENKPMIEGNGPKWLFDIDSLTQSMNYVPVAAGTISNESAGTQEEFNAGTSTQKEEISQDCIVMPIWKDASYFDSPSKDVGNGEPKSAADDQKQVEDGPHNESDEKDKSEDDSSPKEVNAAGQHVNTASPEVNTGRFKLNTVDPSVNTASSYDPDSPKDMFKLGASHTLEATHVEFFSDEDEPEVDLEKPLVKDGDADDVNIQLYRYMIGSLMYLTSSRPDIMFACKKQTVVATSTTEAGYVAAASCCGQVLWIQNQLLDYGYNFMNTVINIDNNSTICIIENLVQHSKTKHKEIRHHFIRDFNAKKLIQMVKIHTDHNVADLLTKGFDAGRFQYLVLSIGMLNP
ncbi:putative ribonuclease H-like domain-containing protein [Tanacetum coccineum]